VSLKTERQEKFRSYPEPTQGLWPSRLRRIGRNAGEGTRQNRLVTSGERVAGDLAPLRGCKNGRLALTRALRLFTKNTAFRNGGSL